MKQAFTLVELLVVVLIIGVLTSIAIPMYQGAVDKSHWSTMLPAAKAIKDAEEAIKMTNGEYTSQMDDLDVTMNNENLNFTLTTPNNMSDPNVIRVTNPKLANVRLASYLDDSPKFAGQLHCEANDERGTRLCEKLLGGQELTSADGYTGYLLDQAIDKDTCDDVGRSWSNNFTKCFKTAEERCLANDMPYKNGKCGYQGKDNVIVKEGATCAAGVHDSEFCTHIQVYAGGICNAQVAWTDVCGDSDFYPGSSCLVTGGYFGGSTACNNSRFDQASCVGGSPSSCLGGTYTNGSVCTANFEYSCSGSFSSGSKCIANKMGSCTGDYSEGACCEGQYCPSNVPKC